MTQVLEKPFEQVTPGELRSAIENKFNSLSRFCMLTGFNYTTATKSLRGIYVSNQDNLRRMQEVARGTENKPIAGVNLPEAKRQEMKIAFKRKFTTLADFTDANDGFSVSWVSAFLNGSGQRLTPKIRQFAEILGVQIV